MKFFAGTFLLSNLLLYQRIIIFKLINSLLNENK